MILTGEPKYWEEKKLVALPLCLPSERRGLAFDRVLGAGDWGRGGGRRETFQNIAFSFTLCVLLFVTATELLGQTVIEFGVYLTVRHSIDCLVFI